MIIKIESNKTIIHKESNGFCIVYTEHAMFVGIYFPHKNQYMLAGRTDNAFSVFFCCEQLFIQEFIFHCVHVKDGNDRYWSFEMNKIHFYSSNQRFERLQDVLKYIEQNKLKNYEHVLFLYRMYKQHIGC